MRELHYLLGIVSTLLVIFSISINSSFCVRIIHDEVCKDIRVIEKVKSDTAEYLLKEEYPLKSFVLYTVRNLLREEANYAISEKIELIKTNLVHTYTEGPTKLSEGKYNCISTFSYMGRELTVEYNVYKGKIYEVELQKIHFRY